MCHCEKQLSLRSDRQCCAFGGFGNGRNDWLKNGKYQKCGQRGQKTFIHPEAAVINPLVPEE